jgi:hypothetical protein
MFDTGASDLIISTATARSLVILPDAEAPLVPGGKPIGHGQLDTLTLGDFSVANVPVALYSEDQLDYIVGSASIDGVLGIRPFAGRQVTVDIAAQVMEIVEPDRRCRKQLDSNRVGVEVPFWLHETHFLYVLGRMNGAEGIYLLNTGMRGADLTANEAAFAHAGVGAPVVRPNRSPTAHIERFELGEFVTEDLGAAWGFYKHNATIDKFRLDGMLGLPVLGSGRWTIDFEQQKLYIRASSPAANTSDQPAPDQLPRDVPRGVPPTVK